MQAQKFLEKYEQDQCLFCHGLKEISLFDVYDANHELFTIFGVIDKNNLIIERIGNRSGVCKINFCPMCGRELTKEV